MLTYLYIPEMSGKVVGSLAKLESDNFMHYQIRTAHNVS